MLEDLSVILEDFDERVAQSVDVGDGHFADPDPAMGGHGK